MDRQDSLAALIEPTLSGLGYELVRVVVSGRDRPTLQVMIERIDGAAITVDDCETASRALSAKLDVEDPIASAYTLEVSSPGIDRPLTRRSDFADWTGHEARIKFVEPIDGAKQVSGDIEGIDGETIRIATSKGVRLFLFDQVASAKLLLTDKLINATAPLSTEGADIIKTEG
jgi:ribosome maturation factor RimP